MVLNALCGAAIAESAIPIHHQPGGRLGDYELTRPLGNGLRTVWLTAMQAVATGGPQNSPSWPHEQERRGGLHSRARVAAAVNHPQVVAVHDVGVLDDITFISTEYVPGSTLSE